MFEKKKLDFGCALWGDEEVDYSYGNEYDLSLFFEYLICYKGVTRFYFTNFKRFNRFCWEILSELKKGYAHIKRIWIVRNYSENLFTDYLPYGCTDMDFDDKQYIKVDSPKSSMEENISVCKSVFQLSLFNIFCFERQNTTNKHPQSLSDLAYQICASGEDVRSIYNVYVPKGLRKYQPN